MSNMSDGLNFLPRPGEPESAMTPGMAAPAPRGLTEKLTGDLFAFTPPNMPDTSIQAPQPPGLTLQEPATWTYDFDPATGSSRATYIGEVNGPLGPIGGVASFNARVGAVTLATADITGAGGATAAQLAGFLPLSGGALSGGLTGTTIGASGLITPAALVGIAGTAAANNVQAGSVGEFISANITTPVALIAAGTTVNVGSISLTPGDWDVGGYVAITAAAATVTVFVQMAVSTVSATMPSAPSGLFPTTSFTIQSAGATTFNYPAPSGRLSIAATTTLFLVAASSFSAGASNATGFIWARRAR